MLLIVWIMTSCICFSQTDNELKPDTILTINGNSLFAFRVKDQIPVIAKHIVRSEKSVEIENVYQKNQLICDSIIEYNNEVICNQELKIKTLKRSRVTLLIISVLVVALTLFVK